MRALNHFEEQECNGGCALIGVSLIFTGVIATLIVIAMKDNFSE